MSASPDNYRARLEHAIVHALIAELATAGFVPVQVWDGEEYVAACDAQAVIEAVFAVDDTPTIHFAPAADPSAWGKLGVMVAPGNGQDLIVDYHCGDASFSAAIDRVCDRISEADGRS